MISSTTLIIDLKMDLSLVFALIKYFLSQNSYMTNVVNEYNTNGLSHNSEDSLESTTFDYGSV